MKKHEKKGIAYEKCRVIKIDRDAVHELLNEFFVEHNPHLQAEK